MKRRSKRRTPTSIWRRATSTARKGRISPKKSSSPTTTRRPCRGRRFDVDEALRKTIWTLKSYSSTPARRCRTSPRRFRRSRTPRDTHSLGNETARRCLRLDEDSSRSRARASCSSTPDQVLPSYDMTSSRCYSSRNRFLGCKIHHTCSVQAAPSKQLSCFSSLSWKRCLESS